MLGCIGGEIWCGDGGWWWLCDVVVVGMSGWWFEVWFYCVVG